MITLMPKPLPIARLIPLEPPMNPLPPHLLRRKIRRMLLITLALALLLIATLQLIACAPAALQVRPAQPLPAPCLTIPGSLLQDYPLPAWLRSSLAKPISATSPTVRCRPENGAR